MASNPPPPPTEYGWNARAARYVDLSTGRFVARQAVLDVMEARIDDGVGRLRAMAQGVIDGRVPVSALQEAGIVELRRAHTQIAALGRGGWSQMRNTDWLDVGRQLKFEYRHWRDFMGQVARGELSAAQIEMRFGMYENHIWTSYWKAQTTASREAGFVEERRIRQAAESCPECLGYEGRGWQPIGSLPEPGQESSCGANCKCVKEYR